LVEVAAIKTIMKEEGRRKKEKGRRKKEEGGFEMGIGTSTQNKRPE
jgi:hypothetical protein